VQRGACRVHADETNAVSGNERRRRRRNGSACCSRREAGRRGWQFGSLRRVGCEDREDADGHGSVVRRAADPVARGARCVGGGSSISAGNAATVPACITHGVRVHAMSSHEHAAWCAHGDDGRGLHGVPSRAGAGGTMCGLPRRCCCRYAQRAAAGDDADCGAAGGRAHGAVSTRPAPCAGVHGVPHGAADLRDSARRVHVVPHRASRTGAGVRFVSRRAADRSAYPNGACLVQRGGLSPVAAVRRSGAHTHALHGLSPGAGGSQAGQELQRLSRAASLGGGRVGASPAG
jgi:hypothetical protein